MHVNALLLMGTLPFSSSAPGFDFAADVAFLQKYHDAIVLSSPDGSAKAAVVPAYQGRVMTSTAEGDHGFSFGWINRDLIAAGKVQPHINAYGGEDRLWLGPEGGPFSLFFSPSAPAQSLEHWQTPRLIDTAAWSVAEKSSAAVRLTARAHLINRAGTELDLALERTVRLLDRSAVQGFLGTDLPEDARLVAFESDNVIRNAGKAAWSKATGAPSLWVLGMFQSGPRTTIVMPYRNDISAALPVVRSDYFGPIGSDRLRTGAGAIFYSGDARSRGKIGVSPARARPVAGSWDAARGVLTLTQFDLPEDAARQPYVDSRWIDMSDPYAGDAVNAYNDGPPSPGQPQLGPFYEIESSSPAALLAPGGTLRHRHRTFHFQGDRAELNRLSHAVLGVSLDEIEGAFGE
jgi:hypothetical protein